MGGIYREKGPIIPGPHYAMQVWYVRNIHGDPPGIIYEPLPDYEPGPRVDAAMSLAQAEQAKAGQ